MKKKRFLIAVMVLFSIIRILNSSIARAEVLVYDNNNQYLGILDGMYNTDFYVFIPSLNAIYGVAYDYDTPCFSNPAYFESTNCSGTPYAKGPLPSIFDLSGTPHGNFYLPKFSGKKTFSASSSYGWDCQCRVLSGEQPTEYYPLVEVQLPFTTPIALPLIFEVRNRAVVIPLN